MRCGHGRVGQEELLETDPDHSQAAAKSNHWEALSPTGGLEAGRQLIGLPPADSQQGCCLLDGEQVGDVLREDAGWAVGLGVFRHGREVTPLSFLGQRVE